MSEDYSVSKWFPGVNRRQFMRVAAGTIGSTAAAGSGRAATSQTVVEVVQGDATYRVTPFSTGETVEQFYDYYSAESHTSTGVERSNTSLLFFWEGPQGLSLVVLHDRPDDDGGGAVSFEFTGLPVEEGYWLLRDDAEFAARDTSPDWTWAASKTDGGVFRGGLQEGVEFSLDPRFNEAAAKEPLTSGHIENWQLLSGDAASPNRTDLDMATEVSFAVRGADETRFDAVKAEKLNLATRIDGVSRQLEDRARVEPTLNALEQRIDDGDVPEGDAVDAVERMLLAENVTEATVTSLGPIGDDGYDAGGHDRRIQTPDGTAAYHTSKNAVDGGISIFLSILLSNAGLKHLRRFLPGWAVSKFDTARSILRDLLDDFLAAILGVFDDLLSRARSLVDDIDGKIRPMLRAGGRKAGEKAATKALDILSDGDVFLANLLTGLFETTTPNNLDDALAELDGDLGGDGEIRATETSRAATQAAQEAVDSIREQVEGARKAHESLRIAKLLVDVLEIIGYALAATPLVAGAAAIQLSAMVVNVLFSATQLVVGVGTMFSVADAHNDGLRRIVSPQGGE